MTFFLLHSSSITKPSSPFSTLSCSFKPHRITNPITPKPKTIPATDRVIDFGKHKGKMLGTLPSSYLKWVSKNLRARDFEEWAKLADQVLQDHVYRDRIEWEFAESVLTGKGGNNIAAGTDESAVSQLLELSERFGWDNEDKIEWSKIDFELLGTSKGGRIPRILDGDNGGKEEKEKEMVRVKKEELSESEERRRERRIRMKEKEKKKKKMGIRDNISGKFGNENGDGRIKSEKSGEDLNMENRNPFPGREALLKKVLNSKRFL